MDAYIGEIRPFAISFTPYGWLPCDGSSYSIQSEQALYAVIGTRFGSTSAQTFKVPDLRGITLLGVDPSTPGYTVPGAAGGVDTVPITNTTMATHNHQLQAVTRTGAGQTANAESQPGPNVYLTNAYSLGANKGVIAYSNVADLTVAMAQATISLNRQTTAVTPHSNVSPYLTLNYCICTYGYFPIRG